MEAMREHAEATLCITCFILVPIRIDSSACTIICADLTLDKCPFLVGAHLSRITFFSMVSMTGGRSFHGGLVESRGEIIIVAKQGKCTERGKIGRKFEICGR